MSARQLPLARAGHAWSAPRRVTAALFVALAVHVVPAIARACAACGPLENARERKAFFDQTLFMTLLPLAAIAVGLVWLARRGRGLLADEFSEREDAVVPAIAVQPATDAAH